MNPWWKVSFAIVMVALSIITGCRDNPQSLEEEIPEGVPKYQVFEKEDVKVQHNLTLRKYSVVPDSVLVGEEEIRKIAENIVSNARNNVTFDLVAIYLYDDRREIGLGGYRIAKAEYAPRGGLEAADRSRTFQNHEFTFEFGSALSGKLPKDNEQYPAKEELDMYFDYKLQMLSDKHPRNETMPPDANMSEWMAENAKRTQQFEDDTIAALADKYKSTPEKVKEIIHKCNIR